MAKYHFQQKLTFGANKSNISLVNFTDILHTKIFIQFAKIRLKTQTADNML